MAAVTKSNITFALCSLLFLVILLYPTNHMHSFPSISYLTLTSTSRLLQDEAIPKIKKGDFSLARIEEQLAKARGEIHKAIVEKSFESSNANESFIPEGTIYKNPFAFFQLSVYLLLLLLFLFFVSYNHIMFWELHLFKTI
ncbi:hypothetical protein HanXRQr2_Chr10g0462261 [Helianthus annuus]|uniref:Uncharacterized protein n=1 Tax=Helianthus annuus TaxID=4232 RepID=A0A9K3I1L3_HELAN|nr:hypothetical protein HanXRQr2_Chr10g0462261 [Helianthus annuus]KAJ0515342.1 hypothetical protein HanHA300_Chr10g0379551 [Helianthus annuus]KAJ0531536.1 hypothetical protein HanHA89_Chr10g0402121 [Helianthus annuus]KAJ0698379.1 hypothetical protein HanLR1_Chr10g0379361 [Helianthus annuus]